MNNSDQPLFHKSVLVAETLEALNLKPNGVYIDATFGSGGHTRAMLEQEPTCTVIGIDWDRQSFDTYTPIIQEEFGERFIPLWGNFAHIYKLIKKAKYSHVDGILADFGTSQMQIVERAGFSFISDTPLDMRMSTSHHKMTAAHVVNNAEAWELAQIFFDFGEERNAKTIAAAIVMDRKKKPFITTRDLASLIERITPRTSKSRIHPATRVFQALRIYINKELDQIHSFLAGSIQILAPKGRLACISFHSLEDRIVKNFLRNEQFKNTLETITIKAIAPSEEEIEQNPSSRSAKLRVGQRV